jgi:hypothetical protein
MSAPVRYIGQVAVPHAAAGTASVALVLAACQTVDLGAELQQQWVGKPMAQVIGATRAPERFVPLGNGEMVYVWSKSYGNTTTAVDCSKSLDGKVDCTQTVKKVEGCEVTAVANREGIVTQMSARNCPSTFLVIDGKRYFQW